jgi:hypothetical protein
LTDRHPATTVQTPGLARIQAVARMLWGCAGIADLAHGVQQNQNLGFGTGSAMA